MCCENGPRPGEKAAVVRVCVFCETWGSGGIETFLLGVMKHVDRTRFDVRIVTAELRSEAYLPELERLGLELVVLPDSRWSSHMRFGAFYRYLRGNAFDAAHFNLYEGLSLGYVAAAKRAGVPVRIAHSHNIGLRKSALKPLKLAVHYMAKTVFSNAATARLACSATAASFLFPRQIISAGRWTYLPNGIQLERFVFDGEKRRAMRKELSASEQFVIGCVGRLCQQKNQSFLLDVFSRIHMKDPSARLIFVGEGEDEGMLKRRSEELGLAQSVSFLGVSQRIPELLCAFDALAFPSVFEGLGIVAIEAQAAGLPVICSDRVPREAAVTDLAEFLPLNGSEERWAERLMACRRERRQDMSGGMRRAGYAVEQTAENLQKFWAAELP